MLTDNLPKMLKKPQRGTKESLIVALVLSNILTVLYVFKPAALQFVQIDQSKLLETIMSLFVVAVFMERAIEAILVPMRTPARQEIEQQITRMHASQDADKEAKEARLREKLETYKLETAKRAYWMSFVFGLAISLAGVRALSGLVAPTDSVFFAFVDVMLTGGVISGGSAAIDKMGRRISNTLNLTSAASSTVKRIEPPQSGGPEAAPPASSPAP